MERGKKTFRLPEDVTTALDALSSEESRSQTEIVIDAIRLYRDKAAINQPGSLMPAYVVQAAEAVCGTLQTTLNAKSNQLISSVAIQLFVIQRIMADNLQVSMADIDEYTQQALEMLKHNNRVFRMQEFM